MQFFLLAVPSGLLCILIHIVDIIFCLYNLCVRLCTVYTCMHENTCRSKTKTLCAVSCFTALLDLFPGCSISHWTWNQACSQQISANAYLYTLQHRWESHLPFYKGAGDLNFVWTFGIIMTSYGKDPFIIMKWILSWQYHLQCWGSNPQSCSF